MNHRFCVHRLLTFTSILSCTNTLIISKPTGYKNEKKKSICFLVLATLKRYLAVVFCGYKLVGAQTELSSVVTVCPPASVIQVSKVLVGH